MARGDPQLEAEGEGHPTDQSPVPFARSDPQHGPAWELLKVVCPSMGGIFVPTDPTGTLLATDAAVLCSAMQGLDQPLPPQWWWQRGWSVEDVRAVSEAVNEALKQTAQVSSDLIRLGH